MRKKIINFFFILFFCISFNSPLESVENKIIFKINNQIVTSVDLLNEAEYLKILNNNLNNLPKEKLFDIAKQSLIREIIKKIEANSFFTNPKIEEKFLEPYLNEIIKKTNLKTKDQLRNYIQERGLDLKVLKKKIEIEILWNQLILNKFSKNVKIDREEIKRGLMINTIQKRYFLSEIVFNLDKENLDEKFKKIKDAIEKNGFENAATLYSISDSSRTGGKLGWVKFNSLSEVIKKELLKIKKNNFTYPIVIPGGFLILKIEDEEEIKSEIKNIEAEIESISMEMTNKQLNQYSNIYFNKIKKEYEINEL